MRILMYNSTETNDWEDLFLQNRFRFHPIERSQVNSRFVQIGMNLLAAAVIFSILTSAFCSSIVFAQGDTSVSEPDASDTAESSASPATSSDPAVTDSSSTGTVLLDPTGAGAPAIDGNAYVLYDAQSGVFLLGRNQDTPLPPASITKVMTILLAYEKLNLSDVIVVTRDMYESIPSDYQRLGLVEGEEITVEEAIYASLLISACDASMALAIAIGGTVEGFADLMNEKALELGCTNTHFTNPYGISDEDHLTTAHDMAIIMAAALQNESYRKISTTSDYTMPATNKNSEARNLVNGNQFIKTPKYAYEYYIGGKTGFTNLSAYTIAAGAQKDGTTLIAVVLGASSSEVRYSELISLFEYGFATYSTTAVDPNDYAALQQQTIDQVNSGISNAGYSFSITDTTLTFIPYCTTTSARFAGGYTPVIDVSQAVIQAGVSLQVLDFPLYRQYADGTKDLVGSFSITICDAKTAETASEPIAQQNKTSLGTILLRVGIIVSLIAVLTICIIFYVMLQRKNKRRRTYRKPRIL